MTQVSGYNFAAKLTAGPINNNMTAVIATPLASSPNVDKVNWKVTANGYVYVDPAVGVAFGPTFINVTNRTGISWPQHSEVVLSTPYIPNQTALEQTVAGHTTQLANHATRITALESAADPETLPA